MWLLKNEAEAPVLTSVERQRLQNHLQIQLNQMNQGESQGLVQQHPLRIQQPNQPVKLQKSFMDGDLDFVSNSFISEISFVS